MKCGSKSGLFGYRLRIICHTHTLSFFIPPQAFQISWLFRNLPWSESGSFYSTVNFNAFRHDYYSYISNQRMQWLESQIFKLLLSDSATQSTAHFPTVHQKRKTKVNSKQTCNKNVWILISHYANDQFYCHSGIKWVTKWCQSTVTLGFIVQCVIRYERFAFDKFQTDALFPWWIH